LPASDYIDLGLWQSLDPGVRMRTKGNPSEHKNSVEDDIEAVCEGGAQECHTLEDVIREIPGVGVEKLKIPG